MSYNLPNPCLVGILLAVSTHNGPQIIFSYPETLSSRKLPRLTTGDDAQPDDDFDDEDYEAEDSAVAELGDSQWDFNHPDYYLGTKFDLMTFLDARDVRQTKGVTSGTASGGSTATKASAKGAAQILGFEPEQLSEMLSPPRAMCNRRFDVMLERMVFLGLPIHVDSDGSWRPRKRQNTFANASRSELDGGGAEQDENGTSASGTPLRMFHLVFIMDPPDIERNYRIDEMFYNVISKLALVLRYEQHKHDYVWDEVKAISKLREEWRALDAELPVDERATLSEYFVAKSPLCRMMSDCFHAISTSQIAVLNINEKLRSFQIPIKTEFRSIPDQTVPYNPGSYLTSTNNCLGKSGLAHLGETRRYNDNNLMQQILRRTGPENDNSGGPEGSDDDDDVNENTDDIIHYALLLYDEPDQIIRDIKAELNTEVSRFVRMLKPTESLSKICISLRHSDAKSTGHLQESEVKALALYLVFWRKARVIPPLSTRAIYIVSPIAPIATKFHGDIATFSQQFPTVPSLPDFLKLLSTRSKKPRPFASIIPSRDHKDMYLTALAWLARYGYVTQLHTYIWLKVLKKTKMKVEEELEEELGKAPKKKRDSSSHLKLVSVTDNKLQSSVDNSSKQNDGLKQKRLPREKEGIESLHRKLEATIIPEFVLEDDGDTILVDPGRATSLERRWIKKIIQDECNLSPELTAVFYKLLKYMNGKSSLELLLLRENVSRLELKKLLLAIDDYVISVRHW